MSEVREPYERNLRKDFVWSKTRREMLADGVMGESGRPYNKAGGRTRLEGWKADYVANLTLNVRVVDQGDEGIKAASELEAAGFEVAKMLSTAASEVDRQGFPAGTNVALGYEARHMHATVGWLRPIMLMNYFDPADPVAPHVLASMGEKDNGYSTHKSWQKMTRNIREEFASQIAAVREALADIPAFQMRYRGYQVFPDSVLARNLDGGSFLNNVINNSFGAWPELDGADPTVSPNDVGRNGQRGALGHVSIAVSTADVPLEALVSVSKKPGRGVTPKVDFPVNRVTLDLQTYSLLTNAQGDRVGTPLSLATVAAFDLAPARPHERSGPGLSI